MNDTPTPRTDDFCNGLRSNCLETTQGAVDLANFARQLEQELNKVQAERDQLRRVCDELGESGSGIKHNILHGYDNCKYSCKYLDQQCNCGIIPLKQKFDSALESYNQLPHVLKNKTK